LGESAVGAAFREAALFGAGGRDGIARVPFTGLANFTNDSGNIQEKSGKCLMPFDKTAISGMIPEKCFEHAA
jgi:hypothetical protein